MSKATLTIIEGREFGREVIPADGFEFLRCTFDGTVLLFRGERNFTLPESGGDFEIALDGNALVVMNQLALLHGMGLNDFVEGLFDRVRQPFRGAVN